MDPRSPEPETIVADVGATYVRVALARHGALGPILTRNVADLRREAEAGIVPAVAELLVEARDAGWPDTASSERPVGVGIGICAAVDARGFIQKPLPFGVPSGHLAVDVVERALGLPVAIDNDANMAALGELRYGAGRGYDSFVLLTLGTNIGMGIVSNGRVLSGAYGGAGEAGMLLVPVQTMDSPASSGRRVDAGPLGVHVSRAPAGYAWIEELVGGGAMATALAERRGESGGAGANRRVLREAAAGDPDALAVVDLAIEGWAYAIACYIALLDPAVIVLSGGLSGDVGPFLDRLRQRAAALSRAEPRLAIAELGGKGGLVGASVAAEALS